MNASQSHKDIEIKPVTTNADRAAFIEVPYDLYGAGENWVPPLRHERREHVSSEKNPYFEHAEVAMWTASRGGRPIGRISAQICKLHQERYGDLTGHFGFLEGEDDAELFDALAATAAAWLKQRGMQRMAGPFSFSINDESGLLIEGFDTPPSMMMNHAKPYYAEQLERLGFTAAKDLFAYEYTCDMKLPRPIASMLERVHASGDLEVRAWDMKNFDRDMRIVIDIFNDAWSDNWGFVPMTYNEVKALGDNLKMLVRGEYAAIAFYKGEPAAMCITLPNINDAINDLGGSLLPFGWAKLIWRLKLRPPKSARMPLMGVLKKYQSDIVGSALAVSVIDQVRSYHCGRGTNMCELSWILEDNIPVRKLIEVMGARQYKTYRVFEREL